MKEFQQKKKRKNRLYSGYVVGALFVVTLLLANGIWKLYAKEKQSSDNVVAANAEFKTLSAQQQLLQTQTARLQTSQGVEEEIRQKFQVSKDGEQMLVIVKDTETATTTATSSDESFFGKIKALFSKRW